MVIMSGLQSINLPFGQRLQGPGCCLNPRGSVDPEPFSRGKQTLKTVSYIIQLDRTVWPKRNGNKDWLVMIDSSNK